MIQIKALQEAHETAFTALPASFYSANDKELQYHVHDQVHGARTEQVIFTSDGWAVCTCGTGGLCDHIHSAYEKSLEDGHFAELSSVIEEKLGLRMLQELNRIIPGGEGVRLLTAIRVYEDGCVAIGLSVGQERLYSVKNIEDFILSHRSGVPLEISEKFTYHPLNMRFSKEDERLLSILSNHMLSKTHSVPERNLLAGSKSESEKSSAFPCDGRFVFLEGAFLYSVLHYFEAHEFVFIRGSEKNRQTLIRTLNLPFQFDIRLEGSRLLITAQGFENFTIISPDGRFAVWDQKICHLPVSQARICKLLCETGMTFSYPAKDTEKALSILLPSLSTIGTVIPSGTLAARLISEKLSPVIYLDLVSQNVEAKVEFHYGEIVINPFEVSDNAGASYIGTATDADGHRKLLFRDGKTENEIISFLSASGFAVQSGKIVLRRNKDILDFCTKGIVELEKKCPVYASADFEKVKPRKISPKAVFNIYNNHLVMKLMEESGEAVEAYPLLKAVASRQEYVRLKSGEFLDIRDLTGLAAVAQEVIESAKIDETEEDEDEAEILFETYRSAYMISMLRSAGVTTETDQKVEETVAAFTSGSREAEQFVPEDLKARLTDYQQQGVNWLFSLYHAKMGGILADEMGLGKTVQLIAALTAAKARDGAGLSLIVTPTSLTYHWLAEFKRFSRNMVVRGITGPREDRRKTIEDVKQNGDVDVLLISYPLIHRDIDLLRELKFRFVVLDEAQSVKNAQSLGAETVKSIQAETKFAITGTPMENHTGELWSLFDFILPGYMGTQSTFLHRYGGGEHSEELNMRIRPFLLRRLKSEVLKNLPQKHEQILYASMTTEQERIYRMLIQSLREHVGKTLEEGDLAGARMQVLSLLLRLRQVCCHPKLFMKDYDGTSGKLELLVQTVQNGIDNKHRLLIFSQFVEMLQIIRKRLSREGISSLYLDGNTPPEMRQRLCDRFNGGEGKVFLISLKAGGTGLNLTGADWVIHYDPWWNPAAEDQATDRAHRIGQSRDVEVIRLIAHDTIEEKVTEMSQRKRNVFEKVIVAGETELSSLSEEDIRMLFFVD